MATPNSAGFNESEQMKQIAVETLREYGVGSCGPMGFYGTIGNLSTSAFRSPIDVHIKFEEELAAFLGAESAIIYSQAFAAISSTIPSFAKRGDIIVADRGVSFAIHKGLQISRSTIRWYAHGDMKDLERVLQAVERDNKRKGRKLTRKFIVAEGIFENDGMMLDLPRVVRGDPQRYTADAQIDLKKRYKYRLMLDESQSFGMVGEHGRGLTEYYNIPVRDPSCS